MHESETGVEVGVLRGEVVSAGSAALLSSTDLLGVAHDGWVQGTGKDGRETIMLLGIKLLRTDGGRRSLVALLSCFELRLLRALSLSSGWRLLTVKKI